MGDEYTMYDYREDIDLDPWADAMGWEDYDDDDDMYGDDRDGYEYPEFDS